MLGYSVLLERGQVRMTVMLGTRSQHEDKNANETAERWGSEAAMLYSIRFLKQDGYQGKLLASSRDWADICSMLNALTASFDPDGNIYADVVPNSKSPMSYPHLRR